MPPAGWPAIGAAANIARAAARDHAMNPPRTNRLPWPSLPGSIACGVSWTARDIGFENDSGGRDRQLSKLSSGRLTILSPRLLPAVHGRISGREAHEIRSHSPDELQQEHPPRRCSSHFGIDIVSSVGSFIYLPCRPPETPGSCPPQLVGAHRASKGIPVRPASPRSTIW